MAARVNGFMGGGVAAVCAVLAGCGGAKSTASKGTVALTPVDFAASPTAPPAGLLLASDAAATEAITADAEAPRVAEDAVARVEPEGSGALAPGHGVLSVASGPPETEWKGDGPAPVGGPVLVDAKIGDINGKPVFASKFLESRANKLRERANDLQRMRVRNWRSQWREEALSDFKVGLDTMIADELLRAEALANMTPQQREGLFAWMETVSDKLASQNRGSVSAASRDLALKKNQTLQEYVREREVQELVNHQINQHVRNRVNVSWRDIKQWYDSHYEMYNPPPKAKFRLVQIANRNTQGVDEFVAALAEGKTPFAELAARPYNSNNPKEGGLEEKVLTGDRATMQFYNHAELNKAAQTLEPGQTAGPIQLGDYTAWIHLDEIAGGATSLYDAQMIIERGLNAMKEKVESEKYVARLRSKATVTSVDEMCRRLVAIAEERYLPRED